MTFRVEIAAHPATAFFASFVFFAFFAIKTKHSVPPTHFTAADATVDCDRFHT